MTDQISDGSGRDVMTKINTKDKSMSALKGQDSAGTSEGASADAPAPQAPAQEPTDAAAPDAVGTGPTAGASADAPAAGTPSGHAPATVDNSTAAVRGAFLISDKAGCVM